jgi:hypothetical protein
VHIDRENNEEFQKKIDRLMTLMEKEFEELRSSHGIELDKIRNAYREEIKVITCDFENKCNDIQDLHLHRMSELEERLAYLKELQGSQRLMMESNLTYIKSLEQKLDNERI